MSEDISAYLKLGITVVLTAMVLAITITILTSSLGVFNGFIDKNQSVITNAPSNQLLSMSGREWTCASLYSIMLQCQPSIVHYELQMFDGIDPITLAPVWTDSVNDVRYYYDIQTNTNQTAFELLPRRYADRNVQLTATEAQGGISIVLREVID